MIAIEPVNVWTSSIVLPNKVEPLSNIIEDEISSVWNSCAVNLPVITASPSIVSVEPFIVRFDEAVAAFVVPSEYRTR